jgi:hypothetical protein
MWLSARFKSLNLVRQWSSGIAKFSPIAGRAFGLLSRQLRGVFAPAPLAPALESLRAGAIKAIRGRSVVMGIEAWQK